MTFKPPETFSIADRFLGARLREGQADDVALRTDDGALTYRQVDALANRFANVLADAGVQPEQRVMIALPDGPEFVGALFGTLRLGAVVVMANPELPPDAFASLRDYTRAAVVLAPAFSEGTFAPALRGSRGLRAVLYAGAGSLQARLDAAPATFDPFPTHRDDACIWLFSGGTTGRPKAVLQTHASFANTTELYGKGILGIRRGDVTLSVPKLFFGYATGSNLFFPFAAGATAALFPERVTPDVLFEKIRSLRPTVLVNVPTMIQKMVSHPEAGRQDLSSLRLCTSAGEALSAELHRRWQELWGVPLLDGLGTAEMWHIFLTNRVGDVRPGTLGKPVEGFDVRVMDDDGRELPAGETGWLWVRGGSRALGYWQDAEKTGRAFRGEWYVSGDMVRRDADGYFTYCGRGDDMLRVSGRWLAPAEVEGRLLEHHAVAEAAVVGATDGVGLTKPWAFVLPREGRAPGSEELKSFVRERLEPYKCPREIVVLDAMPRTHLGKIDRGELKRRAGSR
jgi:benzoate-CoA ligase